MWEPRTIAIVVLLSSACTNEARSGIDVGNADGHLDDVGSASDAGAPPSGRDASNIVDHDGGAPTACAQSCDCPQGQGCVQGSCRTLSTPVYCCTKLPCPEGEVCVGASDDPGACPMVQDAGADAGAIDAGPGQIGAACTQDQDCDQTKRYRCWTRDQPPFLWGYCTLPNCSPSCPSGTSCIRFDEPPPNQAVSGCMQVCSLDRDCRSDAYCELIMSAGVSVCIPDCRDDVLDCAPRDGSEWCNRADGRCETTPMQRAGASVGDPCVSNADCGAGDVCFGELGWHFRGGMCTRLCSGAPEASACGANERCQPFSSLGFCFRNCMSGLCPDRSNAVCEKLDPSWTTPSCIAQ